MRSFWMVIVVVLGLSVPAQAQFRNQGVQLPAIGVMNLGTWDRLLHGGAPAQQNFGVNDGEAEEGWNLWDQPTVGLGHMFAIGYQTWVVTEANIGVWTTVLDDTPNPTPVLSLNVSGGLRYNLLEERHRPFVAVHLQTMTLFAFAATGKIAPIPANAFFGNTAFFGGVRPAVGYEWVFGDEQSVQVELGIAGFLVPDGNRGLGGLMLPASTLKVAYLVYF